VERIALEAPAKINWSLDVVGKRPDGYHLLSTVMQAVSLSDRVEVELRPASEGIVLDCDQPGIPCDVRNTCHRAAARFLSEAAGTVRTGIRIRIVKRIPEAAGLAGGSTDAAATLLALSRLLPGAVSSARLPGIAVATGADVPFCLFGGTALCEGIGEILTPLPAFEGVPLLLLKGPFGISTPAAFRALSLEAIDNRPDTPGVCRAVVARDLDALSAATGNVLWPVALTQHPALAEGLAALSTTGPRLAGMSGSGPTLVAAYGDADARDRAASSPVLAALRANGWFLASCETSGQGPREEKA
jgi:4-diphosphocytidyl-2-C-methyl-D-erythritol kinase